MTSVDGVSHHRQSFPLPPSCFPKEFLLSQFPVVCLSPRCSSSEPCSASLPRAASSHCRRLLSLLLHCPLTPTCCLHTRPPNTFTEYQVESAPVRELSGKNKSDRWQMAWCNLCKEMSKMIGFQRKQQQPQLTELPINFCVKAKILKINQEIPLKRAAHCAHWAATYQ